MALRNDEILINIYLYSTSAETSFRNGMDLIVSRAARLFFSLNISVYVGKIWLYVLRFVCEGQTRQVYV